MQKTKAVENELLAGTSDASLGPRTLEGAKVKAGNTALDKAKEEGKEETVLPSPEVAAEKALQIKERYDSGNSTISSASEL